MGSELGASQLVEEQLLAYRKVRQQTLELISTVSPEDCQVQSMAEASPAKWHLAHSSWFFETFVLAKLVGYRSFDPSFGYLFNSYYEGEGPRHPRAERGLLTRPSLSEVLAYRAHVDRAVLAHLGDAELTHQQRDLITLGLHHEQQHQELLITDLLHALSRSRLGPALKQPAANVIQGKGGLGGQVAAAPSEFQHFTEGLCQVGARTDSFFYDNEGPRHQVYVGEFEIACAAVTNGQYLAFLRGGGYQRPTLWLSDGWHWCQRAARTHPLYWRGQAAIEQFTVSGWVPLDETAPVCHLSYYEAAAFAQWAGCRLPTEFEWEVAAGFAQEQGQLRGRSLESGHWMPGGGTPGWLGDVWEWTSSSYSAYPGFQPASGSVGEYNGKFMCGQQVLRGGSCVTPEGHIRVSYRNFFPPAAQWQFSGLRLAR